MNVKILFNKIEYNINLSNFYDISIPLKFNGKQPNFYDVNKAKAQPLITDNTVWSVKDKASCNVPEIFLNIHCNGTHTESVAHLLKDSSSISEIFNEIFIPSILITVDPQKNINNNDYHVKLDDSDLVITEHIINKKLSKFNLKNIKGLILRTLPNSDIKKELFYPKNKYPFFTNKSIKFLNKIGIKHLLVDTPSIDRYDDDGQLGNHRLFWNNSNNIDDQIDINSKKTITEFCYIDNEIGDGMYFVNLQLPHFSLDAAPSRPLLFKATKD